MVGNVSHNSLPFLRRQFPLSHKLLMHNILVVDVCGPIINNALLCGLVACLVITLLAPVGEVVMECSTAIPLRTNHHCCNNILRKILSHIQLSDNDHLHCERGQCFYIAEGWDPGNEDMDEYYLPLNLPWVLFCSWECDCRQEPRVEIDQGKKDWPKSFAASPSPLLVEKTQQPPMWFAWSSPSKMCFGIQFSSK